MAYLNGDNHGNMVLIIAKNILMEGSPLTIRVTCSNSNLTVKSLSSIIACDLIKQGNEIFVRPKLSTSTYESFLKEMEQDLNLVIKK